MARAQILELRPSRLGTCLAPEAAPEARPVRAAGLYVVFTSFDETLAALRVARELAETPETIIRLVDFQIVPVGAPVDAPVGRSPLETEAFQRQVRAVGGNVRMNVYVCRDVRYALPMVFRKHALILLGARHRWWPTRSKRLRRVLEARGHLVLFAGDALQ